MKNEVKKFCVCYDYEAAFHTVLTLTKNKFPHLHLKWLCFKSYFTQNVNYLKSTNLFKSY